MKIAQVSPLFESVPPKLYGGTERVVSYLTEELVNQGHEVTLFASGDSTTKAHLIASTPFSLRQKEDCQDQGAHHFTMLEMVQEEIDKFDIVHYHIDYLHYPLSKRSNKPHVSTLHGRLDIMDLLPLYEKYNDIPVVSISDNQRLPLPDINWQRTIYHGLPKNLYTPHLEQGKYLAFIGRISPEKRPDRAIEIAKMAGIPIKIAAKVDKADKEYYEARIKPLLDHPLVEFIGEIGESEKNEFLGNAIALLFPIDWPEPFGLAMIEAMACGTPVIAWDAGSVPEVIEEGASGFVISSMKKSLEAVNKVFQMDRKMVREAFEKKYTVERMATEYVEVYKAVIEAKNNQANTLHKYASENCFRFSTTEHLENG